jgi:CMP-N,N'-diacetyllegionaminic acid synthase
MKYIAIIPARSGSKRIKNKNLLKIKKKRMFDYTLEAAKKCKKISKIIITTNINKLLGKNSDKIVYIKRPQYLCKDISSTESAMIHAMNSYKFLFKRKDTNIILLQPTSPLRNSLDINKAIVSYEKHKYDSLFSAYEKKFTFWKKKKKTFYPANYSLIKRARGQNMKNVIVENGAIYIFNVSKFKIYKNRLFKKIGVYFMSKRNSVEIDEIEDIELVKSYL